MVNTTETLAALGAMMLVVMQYVREKHAFVRREVEDLGRQSGQLLLLERFKVLVKGRTQDVLLNRGDISQIILSSLCEFVSGDVESQIHSTCVDVAEHIAQLLPHVFLDSAATDQQQNQQRLFDFLPARDVNKQIDEIVRFRLREIDADSYHSKSSRSANPDSGLPIRRRNNPVYSNYVLVGKTPYVSKELTRRL